jgi:predicted nucleotide-binding protein (sugar kinase/HSP70/actin superfamily)
MHPVGSRLFAAAFRGAGIDARPLPLEDDASFALGKRCTRGGECLPAPLTLGSLLRQLDDERANGRDPQNHSAFFMPTCSGPCRFGQYRTLQRLALDRLGYTDVPIVSPTGNNTYYDVEPGLRRRVWEAIVASDILFKMRCRTLPYEVTAGDTSDTLERWTNRLEGALAGGTIDWHEELRLAMDAFLAIPVRPRFKPLVGIVGEIYVRSNAYANGHLIDQIEQLGGEAWLSPMSEWIEYNAWLERFFARLRGEGLRTTVPLALKWHFLHGTAEKMYGRVLRLLHDRLEPDIESVMASGRRVLPAEFEGEAILSAGRALLFGQDGASLVVNCAPFSCMQGNITTALFANLRDAARIPIVNTFHDGVGGNNHALATFLEQAAAAGPGAPRRSRG